MTAPLNTEHLTTSAEEKPKLGEVLREKREEAALSIEDVSNRLRLSVRQIKALENDDFGAFSEAMMTRGFIRNYARLLEIDAEPLLEAYRVYVPNDAPHALSIQSANVLLPSHRRRSWGKYIVLSLLLVFLTGAWVIYNEFFANKNVAEQTVEAVDHAAEKNLPLGENAEANIAANNDSMPEPALPMAERLEQVAPESAAPNSIESGSIESSAGNQLAGTSAIPADSAKPATSPLPVKPQATVKMATGPALKIKFTFSEQSWISVIDRDGNEIFNKTKAAGSTDEVEGQPPLKVVVGNAVGTQVIYKDKPIDLAPYSKLNVARLTLSLE